MVDGLRAATVSLVAGDGPDLSARQLGVFLICYLNDGPHTVRGLAAALDVSKPAISRALNRLETFELARRKIDPRDRRSVLVQQTKKGSDFLRDLRSVLSEAFSPARAASSKTAEPRTTARR
jgi:DNA-binding MarR family transcriptional regulator